MHLRESKQKRANGAIITHLQLAESVWNKATQRADTRIVYNFGRTDDPQIRERLRALARSSLRRVAPEEIVAAHPDWTLRDAWPYGDLYVLEHLWARIGMPERLPALTRDDTRRTLPVERACFAMVANWRLAPASKLYCYEQWLREDVRIADLFSCDVALVFYDTTTLHCEIDAEDAGGAPDVTMRGSVLAGATPYPALRQRGNAKNRRSDVPQVVVGLPMTRDGLPVRSWVVRGDTVDVETVARVTRPRAALVAAWCQVMTLKAVARLQGLRQGTVKAIDQQTLRLAQHNRPLAGITVLGAAEIAGGRVRPPGPCSTPWQDPGDLHASLSSRGATNGI